MLYLDIGEILFAHDTKLRSSVKKVKVTANLVEHIKRSINGLK